MQRQAGGWWWWWRQACVVVRVRGVCAWPEARGWRWTARTSVSLEQSTREGVAAAALSYDYFDRASGVAQGGTLHNTLVTAQHCTTLVEPPQNTVTALYITVTVIHVRVVHEREGSTL